jgi:hypothetical protein
MVPQENMWTLPTAADQAAVLAVVHIDMAGLAGVDDGRDGLAALVLGVDQDRGAGRIEVPHVMRNVLEVADVFAGVEIERDQRVGVEVVARPQRAVEIG